MKTAPSWAQIITKIYLSATVNQNLSKKQHTKSFVPTSEKSVKKSPKVQLYFRKTLQIGSGVSRQSCTDDKVRSNLVFIVTFS